MGKSQRILPLVIATLPIQLNKYFFTNSSFVLGIPIDYLAISIYLSDFAIALYLLLFIFENHQNFKQILQKRKNFIIAILALNLLMFLNPLYSSKNSQIALFFAFRFLEFSLFTLFASIDLESKKTLLQLKKIVYFSLFWQSIIVVYQFLLQRSIGFWILGERSFDSSTPTIANSTIFGKELLRPYGTFPHPNVAGAFFIFFLILVLPDMVKTKYLLKIKKYFVKKIVILLSLISVCLIYSKTALIIVLASPTFYFKSKKNIILFLTLIVFTILIYTRFFSLSYETSVAERLVLFQAAFKIALINPLFGVGSANFISELAKLNLTSIAQVRLLQPVHNVFLLIITQNGLLGLVLFVNFLFVIQKGIATTQKFILFLSILIYLSIDHFLWTLQQGQFLMALVSAYILSSQTNSSS